MTKRLPVEPVSPETRERLLALEGYVILGLPPGRNAYQGYVENSFTMDWEPDYVNFFWSGNATSNFGTSHIVDGKANAEYYIEKLRRDNPEWKIDVWDVRDENLPVKLDWDAWVEAQAYNPNTLSGVTNKHKARNFKFEMADIETKYG